MEILENLEICNNFKEHTPCAPNSKFTKFHNPYLAQNGLVFLVSIFHSRMIYYFVFKCVFPTKSKYRSLSCQKVERARTADHAKQDSSF